MKSFWNIYVLYVEENNSKYTYAVKSRYNTLQGPLEERITDGKVLYERIFTIQAFYGNGHGTVKKSDTGWKA